MDVYSLVAVAGAVIIEGLVGLLVVVVISKMNR